MDVIEEAQRIVSAMKKDPTKKVDLKTAQIRKVLAAVNRIQNRYQVWKTRQLLKNEQTSTLPDDLAREIAFLKVKLAYQAGRQGGKNSLMGKFQDNLIPHIEAVGNDAGKFEEFASLMEAITAYHKYEGGGD